MVAFWMSLIAYGIFGIGIFGFFTFGFLVAYLLFNHYSTHKSIRELKRLADDLADTQYVDTSKHVPHYDTALTFACKNGDFRIVKELVSSGVNVEETKDGSTPLVHAIGEMHEKIALYLIESGANVSATEEGMPEDSFSPLAAAVDDRMVDVMRALLENGADPKLYAPENANLADIAYESGNHKIVALLDEYGVYPHHLLDDYGNKI